MRLREAALAGDDLRGRLWQLAFDEPTPTERLQALRAIASLDREENLELQEQSVESLALGLAE